MNDLIEALKAQTESINRLAESNEAMVTTIAELLQTFENEEPEGQDYLSAPRPS